MDGKQVSVLLANGNPVIVQEGGTENGDRMRDEMLAVCKGALPLVRQEAGTLYNGDGTLKYIGSPDDAILDYDPDDDDIELWEQMHDGRISRRGISSIYAGTPDTAPPSPLLESQALLSGLPKVPDTQQ